MRALVAALLASSACASFEDPSIVLDLRVLAMRTSVLDGNCTPSDQHGSFCYADQVIDVDVDTPNGNDILAQLRNVDVRALISDPARNRRLDYTFTLCLPDDDERCDLSLPHAELISGILEDPERLEDGPAIPNTEIEMDPIIGHGQLVLAMLNEAVKKNPIDVLGGVDLLIELRIGGEGEAPAKRIVAVKRLKISARIPATRSANRNPFIDSLDGAMGAVPFTPPQPGDTRTRCQEFVVIDSLPSLSPGEIVTLFPVERDGVREDYDAPALDGSGVPLTETLSYQWIATGGSWSDETTGGGHDILGNQSLLGSDWRAPANSGRYSIWVIQRDERFGVTWHETCIEVR